MSTNEVNAQVPTAPAVNKNRRGITNATRSTTRKKFNEKTDANQTNGLFLAHLDSVEVKMVKPQEDGGLAQFAGLDVPVLTITYASNEAKADDRKYVSQRYFPIPSSVDTIPGGQAAWRVDSMFAWLKHIYTVFVLKEREMTEQEEDALSLDFEDFDDDLNYQPVDAKVIIDSYTKVFNNFVALLNNDGKPYYKDAKGAFIPIWLKLLRFTKNKGEWRALVGTPNSSNYGDLAFPTFVGEGCIELFVQNKAPKIYIDRIKETIRFVATEKPKPANLGGQGAIPMPAPGGAMFAPDAGGFTDTSVNPANAYSAEAEDLPF